MGKALSVALVSGPVYDPLYQSIQTFTKRTGVEVSIAYSGDHPALNHHLSSLKEVPYDLVSTHTKYAPSQLDFLAPLEDIVDKNLLSDFMPLLLELSNINGSLYGLPRNIDVRLLHYRADIIAPPPHTWDELFDLAKFASDPPGMYGFVFPGCESGLFGTFYELTEMAGGRLFPENLVPEIENEAGYWALDLLRRFYAEGITPRNITGWHYEKVHECFRNGHALMVCDWPGYYSLYLDPSASVVYDRFALARYPVGPAGRSLSYGGGHTFALTKRGIDNPAAQELLLFLTDFDQQLFEARLGCVPVRRTVMEAMRAESDENSRKRLGMLDDVISNHILVPPKFAQYPDVESVLWHTVQSAIVGDLNVKEALRSIRIKIEHIVSLSDDDISRSNGKPVVPIQLPI